MVHTGAVAIFDAVPEEGKDGSDGWVCQQCVRVLGIYGSDPSDKGGSVFFSSFFEAFLEDVFGPWPNKWKVTTSIDL